MQDFGYSAVRNEVEIIVNKPSSQPIHTKSENASDQMGLNMSDRFFGQLQSMNQLRNFASGSGSNEVYFSSTSSYSGMMRGSPGVRKALEQYANGGDKSRQYSFTTPSFNPFKNTVEQNAESLEAHLDVVVFMNLPRLTIGSYRATIVPIKSSDVYVRVHLTNNMVVFTKVCKLIFG